MIKKNNNVMEQFNQYKSNIGIEIHVQLKTNSKIFCSCPNKFGDQPNKNICQICTGQPGSLPALNKKVVDFAIMAGLATECKINELSRFARKHYNYPDLPKNFQITQFNYPICTNGNVTIKTSNETEKKIRIRRIHIEEDAGKTIHKQNESFIDLNRAGTPLLEIVSEPDISNSYEAKAYLTKLKTTVQYLKISNADMEKGSFRADINVSVTTKESKTLGKKVELKNINSFKFIVNAIDHEIKRQIEVIETGKKVKQETRLWDSKKQISIFMRSKEEFDDYRYVLEPDLPLIIVDQKWLESIKSQIPELPTQKLNRFKKDYNISHDQAEILVNNLDIANFFEDVSKICKNPKIICNWILRNLLAYLKENKLNLQESKITPKKFAQLINALDKGIINTKTAQDVFLEMAKTEKSPEIIIKEKGLQQIGSFEDLEKIVLEIIKNNPEQVNKYRSGKERLFTFFVGQAMKETKGKGNPKIIQELLKKHLKK
ncbi:Asp-tRNA(Asn)/Glu-tRNA(Gln) amidotransferase subunit GatB [Candidatus Babeliales bacterium]|nr:Asp-tRNA(Asn)/Glu-tRNA(Gln) amidotransferase subunit GatB [Candidatus Babeliales bacterium]